MLNLLAEAPAGLRQRELAEAMVVDPSSTTYAVDSLVSLGHVRRAEDKTDRRAWRVMLTPGGRALHARVTPAYEAALQHVARALDPADLARLEQVLADIQALAMQAVDRVLDAEPAVRRNLRTKS